jgi:hypothetical protein
VIEDVYLKQVKVKQYMPENDDDNDDDNDKNFSLRRSFGRGSFPAPQQADENDDDVLNNNLAKDGEDNDNDDDDDDFDDFVKP